MTLSSLQTKLDTAKTDTGIAAVVVDSTLYFNSKREKTYPFVLWAMDGLPFEKDIRTTTIQKTEELTFTVFALVSFNPDSDNRRTKWDTLKGYCEAYLNAVNAVSDIEIVGIENIKGVYMHEGEESYDKELGILFPSIKLRLFCNG